MSSRSRRRREVTFNFNLNPRFGEEDEERLCWKTGKTVKKHTD